VWIKWQQKALQTNFKNPQKVAQNDSMVRESTDLLSRRGKLEKNVLFTDLLELEKS
jgi:hypothetical protein